MASGGPVFQQPARPKLAGLGASRSRIRLEPLLGANPRTPSILSEMLERLTRFYAINIRGRSFEELRSIRHQTRAEKALPPVPF